MTDNIESVTVVDGGTTYESQESAMIAKEEADKAKLWMQESERQANLASGSADIAYQARDEAVNVVNSFTQRVTEATNTFNSNATAKTNDFNNNATAKTTAFNDNYTEKKSLIDAQVAIAESSATNANNYKNKAREWAISQNIVDNEDYSSKYYANQSQISAELSAQYANDKINQTHITNCITEISQDIKLELNNGILTLKAGSRVYVPNGAGVFDVVNIQRDIILMSGTTTYEDKLLFTVSSQSSGFGARFSGENNIGSGTLANRPDASSMTFGTGLYYATDENKLYQGVKSTNTWSSGGSLPICIASVTNGVGVTSIDQVFNGFGYIGSTVFALPGVKGLIPNGRNNDGTLKNIEFTTKKVLTLTGSGSSKGVGIYIKSNELQFYGRSYKTFKSLSDVPTNFSGIGFIIDDNLLYTFDSGVSQNHQAYCVGGVYDWTDNKISSFIPKTVFHASDFNDVALKQDLATIPHIVETYVNGTSWYRVYSDGWCEQGANNQTSDTNGGYTVTFLKPFKNTNYNVTGMTIDNAGGTQCIKYTAKSTTSIKFLTTNNTQYSSMKFNWQACGYIS